MRDLITLRTEESSVSLKGKKNFKYKKEREALFCDLGESKLTPAIVRLELVYHLGVG